MNTVASLPAKWRAELADEASEGDIAYNHAMKVCAAELEAALASPDPSVSPAVEGGLPEPFAYLSPRPRQGYTSAANSTYFRSLLDEHRNGRPRWPDDATLLYTDEQMRAYGEQCRLATPEQPAIDIDACVDRFLGWRLPDDFAPDDGISFTPITNPAWLHDNWPIGTNLLTAGQARAMLEYVLNWTAGAPSAQQPLDGPANNAGVATGSRNGPPSESVTRGNPPSNLEQSGSAVQGTDWQLAGVERFTPCCEYTEGGYPHAYMEGVPHGQYVTYDEYMRLAAAHAAEVGERDAEIDRINALHNSVRSRLNEVETAYLDYRARAEAAERDARELRVLLRECLPYVDSTAKAMHILDGFKPGAANEHDELTARVAAAIATTEQAADGLVRDGVGWCRK